MVFAIAAFGPRLAAATTCTVPSDCFGIGEVCNLGVCTPCESSFEDGGINGPLACQDPADPICEIPDGSIGGQCVQCTKDADCPAGDTCDLGTQTCEPGDGGGQDGGSTSDASTGDGAASGSDGGGGETDASAQDGGSSGGGGADGSPDGASTGDASSGDGGGGPPGDASADDAGGPLADAAGDWAADGGVALDGGYVEGDGCACGMLGGGAGEVGAFGLALLAGLAVVARRRTR